MQLAHLATAILIILASSGSALALDQSRDVRTFGQLRSGEQIGALLEDFCRANDGLALPASREVSPAPLAEVLVVRTPDGVIATVILGTDVTSTRSAVFAMDGLIFRLGDECAAPIEAIPVVSMGAEGLTIIQDENGNSDFHLQGESK